MGSNQKESWRDEYRTYLILQMHINKLRKRIDILQIQLANYESQREKVRFASQEYSRKQSRKQRAKKKKLKEVENGK